jgi:hypothetical protein
MTIFSYHLLEVSLLAALKGLFRAPLDKKTTGLIHAEYMTVMTLGSAVFSSKRMLLGQVAIFAQWESEQALEQYLNTTSFGKKLSQGWHVRLSFLRQWGRFSGFQIPEMPSAAYPAAAPVVAVTVARMKPWAVPRFIHWGRPVENLVRDHPGATLSLASIHLPNTVSTFSIWKTTNDMNAMVRGHSPVPQPKRHADAMNERERKDFHFEFTTLRFQALSEFGSWKGRDNYVPFYDPSA